MNEKKDMHQFRLTIGDWSGDGHGRSEDFLVISNVPVERVREAHYKIRDATGIDKVFALSTKRTKSMKKPLLPSRKWDSNLKIAPVWEMEL